MPFLRLLILFYECPKTGLHASKVKKHLSFLKKIAKRYLYTASFRQLQADSFFFDRQ